MTSKRIINVLNGMPTSDGAGVNLTRAVGQPRLRNVDPFLMLDEIRSDQPDDYIAGFPSHPHKGFETLSYMLSGSMAHKDSTGGEGLINSGGVQYMTAGKGIIHSEHPKQDSGLLWGFQLWINLPAKDKLQAPSYRDINSADIPEVNVKGSCTARIIAGSLTSFDAVGPVERADIDMQMYDIKSQQEEAYSLSLKNESRGFIYVYQGSIKVNGHDVHSQHIATFAEGEVLDIESGENSCYLLLAGEPIEEPIVQYGPFVMNTQMEIEQAIRDYQAGTFVSA